MYVLVCTGVGKICFQLQQYSILLIVNLHVKSTVTRQYINLEHYERWCIVYFSLLVLIIQRGKHGAMKFSSIRLNLPEAEGVSLSDLHTRQPHFSVHLEHLLPDDTIEEYFGMIGQEGEFIHTGDYIKLCSSDHEVWTIAQNSEDWLGG